MRDAGVKALANMPLVSVGGKATNDNDNGVLLSVLCMCYLEIYNSFLMVTVIIVIKNK